jgi:hypothetical protein
MNKRVIEVGSGTCLLGVGGREHRPSVVFDASSLAPTGGVNEVQTATVNGSPSGGTFKLSYRGQTTATIAYNAAASAVQSALRALSTIGGTNVAVTGSNGGPYTITFQNNLGNQDVQMISADGSGLTGGTNPSVSVAQTTMGVTYDPRILLGSPTYPGTLVAKTGSTPNKVHEYTGAGGVAEVQTLTITGTPTGGNIVVNYEGETATIAYNSSAAAAQTALNAMDSIAADGGVTVSGGPLPGTALVVTFNQTGARFNLTVQQNNLTGGTTPAGSFSETTAGVDPEQIYGIVDGVEEFISNTSLGDKALPVYYTGLVINTNLLKNYSTYQAAVKAWAAANFNQLRAV